MFPITYLSFIYIFSLILIQLSFILYLFYGVNIPFQNFIVLNLFILFPLYILVYKVKYNRYDLVIILSLLYFLIVLPISSGFNIFETFKSYKDIILPYIIYLFFRSYFKSFRRIQSFTNAVLIGGITCCIYLYLEFITKINKIGLDFWFKLVEYADIYHPWVSKILETNVTNFLNDNMEQIGVYVISYLRPSGIFLDIHTQAFVILSAIFILYSDIINNKNKTKWKWYYFLIIGLFTTTSTLYIVTLILISILFYYKAYKQPKVKALNKKFYFSLFSILCTGFVIFPFYIRQYLGHKIGFGVDQTSVADIILDAIIKLPESLFNLLVSNPKAFLIGTGSSELNVIGGEVHYLGELISFIGVIGTIFYLLPYFLALSNSLKILNGYNKNYSVTPYFFYTVFLTIILFASLFHYSPVNYCTVFLMGFCLYTGFQDNYFIKYDHILKNHQNIS